MLQRSMPSISSLKNRRAAVFGLAALPACFTDLRRRSLARGGGVFYAVRRLACSLAIFPLVWHYRFPCPRDTIFPSDEHMNEGERS